jgi:hypothetical protein
MVMGEKSQSNKVGRGYQKVLNKKDPLDHLIWELGQTGVLDVSVVGIGQEHQVQVVKQYSRKSVPHRGKHTS